jgi:hypothetical protein
MSQEHPGSIALVSILVLLFFGWLINLRWHDVKGSHFIDSRTLRTAPGAENIAAL